KADGTILIMDPSGSESGHFDLMVGSEVNNWTRQHKNGIAFGSSAGFTLPNKAVRSPDAAWVALEKWKALPKEDRKRFAHISPDFVIEIKSETDSLSVLKEKMQEYIENGVRLGWLIDPQKESVWIYRKEGNVEHIDSFEQTLSGEDVLEGFTLQLSQFWPIKD
ncbi:MAG: Uma2 family endonuclease, partial [Bacteroidota bacterium]